ncbi:hypothetical protein V6N11_047707 [Hibiscus sabdariffa]|uniref:Uncharacterized protein n=2 Tax=Hibiscus sabdariffa TaxID=183260 RepID=A0ABR2P7S1_9ROSI
MQGKRDERKGIPNLREGLRATLYISNAWRNVASSAKGPLSTLLITLSEPVSVNLVTARVGGDWKPYSKVARRRHNKPLLRSVVIALHFAGRTVGTDNRRTGLRENKPLSSEESSNKSTSQMRKTRKGKGFGGRKGKV